MSSLSHRLQQRRRSGGFTLIEIMVVVVILGILAAVVVPRIMDRPDDARVAKARQDEANEAELRALEASLKADGKKKA